jgi:phosphoribosyl-AMP cyclohydrolase
MAVVAFGRPHDERPPEQPQFQPTSPSKGLITAIAWTTHGRVLMVAYMNEESFG